MSKALATEAADRVQRNTADEINERVKRETEARVRSYESRSRAEITRRIEELKASGTSSVGWKRTLRRSL